MKISSLAAIGFLGLTAALNAQTDILDARTNFSEGQVVTVTGVVTSDGNLGSVRYIQDETAGIALYPGSNWDGWPTPVPGDELTMTGELTEYNGLLEVGSDGITNVEVLSAGNDLPEFQLITPEQMAESLEGELAHIAGISFDAGGQEIQGNNTYGFSANGEAGNIYIRTDNELVGSILPAGVLDLYGVVSQYSFTGFGGYQLLPRGFGDLVSTSAINISSEVSQYDITASGFGLAWSTDVEGDSKVEYGPTPDLGMEVYDATATTDHALALEGLDAGEIYYARVISTLGEDSTESQVRPYATVSTSPGYIRAYFTTEVDNSVATIENAVALGTNTNDTIAAYITSAQHTLEIAAYNLNNSAISGAINAAVAQGVQVRYIAEGSTANLGLSEVDSSVPVHFRTDGGGSGMHNKFIIGDADYPETAFVLTGSTNFTTNNLNTDPNNVIIFGDQSLARGYRLEFEEMWGSSTMEPDASASLFGEDKTINTPRDFIVGGSHVELFFSPSDGTTTAIQNAILSTDYDMSFAMLSFTRNDLRDAIIEIGESIFINPRGAIEDVAGTGAEFDILFDAGIEVYSHAGLSGQLHHKMAVIDESEPLSDPLVITGSHNWTSTAETANDENTVIVHDERVANLYFQAFEGLLNSMGVSVPLLGSEEMALRVYPNPSTGMVTLDWASGMGSTELALYDIWGKQVWQDALDGNVQTADWSGLSSGIYTLGSPENLFSPVRVVLK